MKKFLIVVTLLSGCISKSLIPLYNFEYSRKNGIDLEITLPYKNTQFTFNFEEENTNYPYLNLRFWRKIKLNQFFNVSLSTNFLIHEIGFSMRIRDNINLFLNGGLLFPFLFGLYLYHYGTGINVRLKKFYFSFRYLYAYGENGKVTDIPYTGYYIKTYTYQITYNFRRMYPGISVFDVYSKKHYERDFKHCGPYISLTIGYIF